MGIIYRDPEDRYYDDTEFAIVKGNTVLGNLMDDVRFYGELALVREGIEKIHEALPDYKYIPMRDVREAMYPEKMTTEQLAEAVDEMCIRDRYWRIVHSQSTKMAVVIREKTMLLLLI